MAILGWALMWVAVFFGPDVYFYTRQRELSDGALLLGFVALVAITTVIVRLTFRGTGSAQINP